MSKRVAIIWASKGAQQQLSSLNIESHSVDWFRSVPDFLDNNDSNVFYDRVIINALHVSGLHPDDPKIANPNPGLSDSDDPRVKALLGYRTYLEDGRSGADGGTETVLFTNTSNKKNLFPLFVDMFGVSESSSATPALNENINLNFLTSLITDTRDIIYGKVLPQLESVLKATSAPVAEVAQPQGTAEEGGSKKRKRGLFGLFKGKEEEVEEVSNVDSTFLTDVPEYDASIQEEEGVTTDEDTSYRDIDINLFQGESETGVYEEEADNTLPSNFYLDDNTPALDTEKLLYFDYESSVDLYWDAEGGRWYNEDGKSVGVVITYGDGSTDKLYDLRYLGTSFLKEEYGYAFDKMGAYLGTADELGLTAGNTPEEEYAASTVEEEAGYGDVSYPVEEYTAPLSDAGGVYEESTSEVVEGSTTDFSYKEDTSYQEEELAPLPSQAGFDYSAVEATGGVLVVQGTATQGYRVAESLQGRASGGRVLLVNLSSSLVEGLDGSYLVGNHTLEGTPFEDSSGLSVYTSTLTHKQSEGMLSDLEGKARGYDTLVLVPGEGNMLSGGSRVYLVESNEASVVNFLYQVSGKEEGTVQVLKSGSQEEFDRLIERISPDYVPGTTNWLEYLA